MRSIADDLKQVDREAMARLSVEERIALALALGDAGFDRARAITWDGVVDALMAHG